MSPGCTCGATLKHSADCVIFWESLPRTMLMGDLCDWSCETCGQWPTEQQESHPLTLLPPPREMELADIASPMLYDYGPGWVPSWRNPPAEWFPALPPRRRVKPW